MGQISSVLYLVLYNWNGILNRSHIDDLVTEIHGRNTAFLSWDTVYSTRYSISILKVEGYVFCNVIFSLGYLYLYMYIKLNILKLFFEKCKQKTNIKKNIYLNSF